MISIGACKWKGAIISIQFSDVLGNQDTLKNYYTFLNLTLIRI